MVIVTTVDVYHVRPRVRFDYLAGRTVRQVLRALRVVGPQGLGPLGSAWVELTDGTAIAVLNGSLPDGGERPGSQRLCRTNGYGRPVRFYSW